MNRVSLWAVLRVAPGQTIREWTLEREIGRGAIGVIYRARHRLDEKQYAIKVLRPELSKIEELRQRFLREAKIITGLKHVNIVESFPAFEEAGRLFLPMELLDGNSLKALMVYSSRPWSYDIIRYYGAQIAEGLAYSHDRGFAHRDVKPGNVIVLLDGLSVKLLDFGLAMGEGCERLTDTGTTVGTPNYLAPEIIDGVRANARSDIYALGVVLFRLVTGFLPFTLTPRANTLVIACEMREQQEAGLPEAISLRKDCPQELSELISEMLAFDPEQRPQSARKVIERLTAPEAVTPPDFTLRLLDVPGGAGSTDGLMGIEIDPNDQTIGARPSKVNRPTSAAVAYSSTEEAVGHEIPSIPSIQPEVRVDTSPTEIIRPPTDSEKKTMVDLDRPGSQERKTKYAVAAVSLIVVAAMLYFFWRSGA